MLGGGGCLFWVVRLWGGVRTLYLRKQVNPLLIRKASNAECFETDCVTHVGRGDFRARMGRQMWVGRQATVGFFKKIYLGLGGALGISLGAHYQGFFIHSSFKVKITLKTQTHQR